MIGWLIPAALGGLALVALPVVVHLLRTHRARRIPFPTLRFIAPAMTSAVKLRPPSDIPLLVVRIGIIAAAALAMAQPLLVTRARVNVWNARLVRAVVVDGGAALQMVDAGGARPAELVKPIAEAEIAGATSAIRIDTLSLADGVTRAAAWLATAPPGRREIVVLSTFTAGALDETTIAQVPSALGLRLVQVGQAETSRSLEGISPLAAPESLGVVQDVQLTGATTSVTRRVRTGEQRGWRVAGLDARTAAVQRLWRTLAVAGTPAPSADQPVALAFGTWPGAETVGRLAADTPRWMLRALARLKADEAFQRAAAVTAETASLSASDAWITVAVDRTGGPVARVARASQELVMEIGAPVDSLFGAVAARALLVARAGEIARPDLEILRVPPATLAGWSRPPPPVDPAAWRSVDGSDARWLWALALVLLGLEHWLRRSATPQVMEVRDAA